MLGDAHKAVWSSTENRPICLEQCEVLSEVRIDSYHFKATWTAAFNEACILWFKDDRIRPVFEALGRFVRFDRERILSFIFRYVTSEDLREEIERRKFECKLSRFSPAFFANLDRLTPEQKAAAYRSLYSLDDMSSELALERKRRIMAMKFHPDRGGSPAAMSAVNEAYEFLMSRSRP